MLESEFPRGTDVIDAVDAVFLSTNEMLITLKCPARAGSSAALTPRRAKALPKMSEGRADLIRLTI